MSFCDSRLDLTCLIKATILVLYVYCTILYDVIQWSGAVSFCDSRLDLTCLIKANY